jgi:hypothetical protein
MSVASLEGGSLTLTNLNITNSQYSDVAGYIPNQAIFTTTKSSVGVNVNSLGITNGANVIELTVPTVGVLGVNGTVNCDSIGLISGTQSVGIDCVSTGIVGVGGAIQLQNGSNTVNLSSGGTNNTLTVGGTCNATTFGITNGSNAVPLTCVSSGVLSVPAINSSGTINANIFGITDGVNGGQLSVNASNQLLWNGVPIS